MNNLDFIDIVKKALTTCEAAGYCIFEDETDWARPSAPNLAEEIITEIDRAGYKLVRQ